MFSRIALSASLLVPLTAFGETRVDFAESLDGSTVVTINRMTDMPQVPISVEFRLRRDTWGFSDANVKCKRLKDCPKEPKFVVKHVAAAPLVLR